MLIESTFSQAKGPKRPSALKLRRLTLGLEQRDVATLTGLNTATVGRLESGVNDPRLSTARALARTLECGVDDLFPQDDDPAGNGAVEKERAGAAPRGG